MVYCGFSFLFIASVAFLLPGRSLEPWAASSGIRARFDYCMCKTESVLSFNSSRVAGPGSLVTIQGWLAWSLIEGRSRLAVNSELARPQDHDHSRSLLEGGRRSLLLKGKGALHAATSATW
ncbi:UNVERIFIED_CONTAM: hypothetical protein Slati_4405000 [Sesamum latifolium]|uniref:Secreted protein n=1 Tax=Sesamum latifolium TaxID=2727402 RepID=A0AAW2SPP9_9LAMI